MRSTDAALALARAIVPAGRTFPAAGERTLAAAEALCADFSPGAVRGLQALAVALDRAAILSTGRRFARLAPDRQEALLRAWERDPLLRWPLFGLALLLKTTHFDDPAYYRAMSCAYEKGGPAEPAPWLRQLRGVADGGAAEEECDVVVVGTGAGGAVVGKELAERGLAVVFVEEGEHHRRDEFTGNAREAHRKFYRQRGGIVAVGNGVIPIFVGRLVGGSTAINTGTCFRTPDWILGRWCEELGTDELAPERLAPHFDRVEAELGVVPGPLDHLGGAARVIARGCDALGWRHFPVRRNAPDCEGQGVCDFGCPTDARRSMNLSYVPAALRRGAVLYPGMRARRVLVEGGRAVGVEARAPRGGATLRVRARAVILAGGAIPTPLLLLGQGIANRSGQVGKNLSLHPAAALSARFDEEIRGFAAIPQGTCCDELHREGILLLGASAPLNVGGAMFALSGRRLTDAMDDFDRVASFAAMIADESRGRVRRGRGGQPLITYWLGDADVARLHRGMVAIGEIFLAAGARKLYPLSPRFPELVGRAGLERFRRQRLTARDFVATSWHPLGTCRMGRDPRRSVIGLDHQAHDVPGLFVVDGAALPGPPAVNPQLTIMAFAHRAADKIAERIGT